MTTTEPAIDWPRLPTIDLLTPEAARRAHRLFTYAREGHDGAAIVVVTVIDRRDHLLARSTFAATVDPRRVSERVLAASPLARCSPYRADSAHRETRIEALVAPRPTAGLSAYERRLREAPRRSA